MWLILGSNLPDSAFLACVAGHIRHWLLLGTGDASVAFKLYPKKATQAWTDSHVSVMSVCSAYMSTIFLDRVVYWRLTPCGEEQPISISSLSR